MKQISLAALFLGAFFFCHSQHTVLQPFALSDVRLLDGPFKDAQQTDLRYIMALDPDRLLAPFQREAGLPVVARNYPNWENTGLEGHIGGHYLSALSLMYAATGDAAVHKRLLYMIDQLDRCQQKNGNGYVGSIPGSKLLWDEIASGKINAESFSLNKHWVPLYNIHKTFAGLVDAYRVAGVAKAKTMLVQLADWFLKTTQQLTDTQLQQMLRSEHGGMNEVFADVAAITGDMKYLRMAARLSHQKVLQPLLHQKDSLNGMHANTQIPKVIGFQRIATVSGDKSWSEAADFFWKTVVGHRTVSIGGNSVREHFHPANDFSSMMESKEGPETCNSYNMLKLTTQLFLSHPDPVYMDYYERTLYNHILSSQHPNGGFVYFTPMRPRHYRVYSQPQEGFWCCVGSGMENHGKYGELIYAHTNDALYVNLFMASTVQWKGMGVTVSQHTGFPFEEKTNLVLRMKQSKHFVLCLRQPFWLLDGTSIVYVNGKKVSCRKNVEGYLVVERTWRDGDKVSMQLPMKTSAVGLPDGSSWVSFMKGPIVLAAATDTTDLVGLRADSSRMGHIANGKLYSIEDAPMLLTSTTALSSLLQPVKGSNMQFHLQQLTPEKYKEVVLKPFFQIHDARYMIYWPVSTPEALEKKKQQVREKEQALLDLEGQTVDQVAPGEQQPESDHQFQGDRTLSGIHMDRHWRHAEGWFSYVLQNKQGAARKIRLTLFGGDSGRSFDVVVNDRLIATITLTGERGGVFYEQDIALPSSIVEAQSAQLVLKFIAKPGSVAGGIYGVRLMK